MAGVGRGISFKAQQEAVCGGRGTGTSLYGTIGVPADFVLLWEPQNCLRNEMDGV